ncbi:MAG: methylenetetrahydrofolate--tRNA-(uracil(54)-C(5))-methyltransferase (FADH(2)-oxidizing) TrmFO [Christensenellales bacterium]|jgi:methylenetetrahydrofolate--tRNA-(uracil-5-)-methyltransferase
MKRKVKIIGGGLAGVEAAYQLAKRGAKVELYEMKPVKFSPAHKSAKLAELVCSNSLKSILPDTASGAIKQEMRLLDSLVIRAGESAAIPAGSALAVDKQLFSDYIEDVLNSFGNLQIIREEVTALNPDEYTIVASGPLTSDALAKSIKELIKGDYLYFYDAVAPVISYDSIDMENAFFASRYMKGDADYINCPLTVDEYDKFYNALVSAECVELKEFDKREIFSGCMPIEVMAKKGYDSIRFGPLKPVGIKNPLTNENYYAVVQLRKENKSGTMYNMVGFQTNLTYREQKRVFSLIPALKSAEFLRYGVMHRNTYMNSPYLLDNTLRLKGTNIYFAGQITGVEGYVESAASGLVAGINVFRSLKGIKPLIPGNETITGALIEYICTENKDFQPMNANFGILPKLAHKNKSDRKKEYAVRSEKAMKEYVKEVLND